MSIIIIIIKAYRRHRYFYSLSLSFSLSLSLSLSYTHTHTHTHTQIPPNRPTLLSSPLNSAQLPHTADECKFFLVSQHCYVYVYEFILISGTRWEVSGRTTTVSQRTLSPPGLCLCKRIGGTHLCNHNLIDKEKTYIF